MRYKLICFDFDHTLTRGTTAAEHISTLLGCRADVEEAEQRFRAGKMTTWQFTDAMAANFQNRRIEEIESCMRSIPLIEDIAEMVDWLKAHGVRVVINTVGFRDLMHPLGEQFDFDDVSGVRLTQVNGRFTGGVDSYFPLENKVHFARNQAAQVGADLSSVIAIGDGLSDLPMFRSVGYSIAFNAPEEVRAKTDAAAEGPSCKALRPRIETILKEKDL